MNARKHLTGCESEADSQRSIAALLDEAGLELWQAPEGFWAIRVKVSKPTSAPSSLPRRARRRRAEGQV